MNVQIKWKTKTFSQLTTSELYGLLKLRVDVFVSEQRRPVADLDGKDLSSQTRHIFGIDACGVVAYARVVPPAVSYPEVSIERVVVRSDFRNQSVGKQLMVEALDVAKATFLGEAVVLHAQQYLEGFYNSFGFKTKGAPFDEGGILHVMMYGRL
jgi:ElaA protein